MKRKILAIFLLLMSTAIFAEEKNIVQENKTQKTKILNVEDVYNNLKIKDKIPYPLFHKAYLGYIQISEKNPGVLVIIDYTKPSNEERFYVIDFNKNKLVYSSRVAHSKNSGLEIPLQFSDDPNSYQSSLGFFLTMGEYDGAYGHSLRLKGLEESINGNAEERAIVIHGGEIVEDSYIKKYGFAGRSLGCPVLPYSKTKEIINYIKNGRVMFIYGNDEDYIDNSTYLSHLSALFDENLPSIANVGTIKENVVEPKKEPVTNVVKNIEPKKEIEKTEVKKIENETKVEKVSPTINSQNLSIKIEENKNREENKLDLKVDKASEKKEKYPKEIIKKSLAIGTKYKKYSI